MNSRSSHGRIQVNTAIIWRTVLEQLENSQIDAVSKAWLQEALLASMPSAETDNVNDEHNQDGDLYFTLRVPNSLAQDVISTRWRRSLENILEEVIRQPVHLSISNSFEGSSSVEDDVSS